MRVCWGTVKETGNTLDPCSAHLDQPVSFPKFVTELPSWHKKIMVPSRNRSLFGQPESGPMALFRWLCLAFALVATSLTSFAQQPCNRGELDKGTKAVALGDIDTAVDLFMPMAIRGCAPAMHNMGVLTAMMSNVESKNAEGRDLRIDSYMWFTLAAEHHQYEPYRQNSLENRKSFVGDLRMTTAQIAEGERLAKAWRAGQDLPKQRPFTSKSNPPIAGKGRIPQWFQEFAAALPKKLRSAFQKGDNSATLSLARPLAKKGHPQAQTIVGMLNYYGRGLPQNYSEAARWYDLAAKQGEPAAQSNLGDMYYGGQGVPRDYGKALELWGKAAEKDHTIAMANMGLFHAEGIGGAKNICEAYAWWRKAAALGGGIGQSNISAMLEIGDGVPKDYLQAYIWSNLAVDHMEPRQGDQLDRAILQRGSLAGKLKTSELELAKLLMIQFSLSEMEASLPPCTQ